MKNLFLCSTFVTVDYKFPFKSIGGKKNPAAFITTAANTYAEKPWMEAEIQKFIDLGFDVETIDIAGKNEKELTSMLARKKVIFVGGGNTFYLLQEAKKSGFDKIIKDLISQGVWYIGSSAGSVIVGPSLEPIKYDDNPKEAPELKDYNSFGIVDFVVLPHYDPNNKESSYKRVVEEFGSKFDLRVLTDQEAFLVQGTTISKI